MAFALDRKPSLETETDRKYPGGKTFLNSNSDLDIENNLLGKRSESNSRKPNCYCETGKFK